MCFGTIMHSDVFGRLETGVTLFCEDESTRDTALNVVTGKHVSLIRSSNSEAFRETNEEMFSRVTYSS